MEGSPGPPQSLGRGSMFRHVALTLTKALVLGAIVYFIVAPLLVAMIRN